MHIKIDQVDKLKITEKEFRQQVLDLGRLLGFKCYFTWGSFHSPAGFPDLAMVKGRRLIFAELKSEKGVMTWAQTEWLKDLEATGKCEVFIWRPSDWEEIVAKLKAIG